MSDYIGNQHLVSQLQPGAGACRGRKSSALGHGEGFLAYGLLQTQSPSSHQPGYNNFDVDDIMTAHFFRGIDGLGDQDTRHIPPSTSRPDSDAAYTSPFNYPVQQDFFQSDTSTSDFGTFTSYPSSSSSSFSTSYSQSSFPTALHSGSHGSFDYSNGIGADNTSYTTASMTSAGFMSPTQACIFPTLPSAFAYATQYDNTTQAFSLGLSSPSTGWTHAAGRHEHTIELQSSDCLGLPQRGMEDYINFNGYGDYSAQRSDVLQQGNDASTQSPGVYSDADDGFLDISSSDSQDSGLTTPLGSGASPVLSDAEAESSLCGSLSPTDSCSNAVTYTGTPAIEVKHIIPKPRTKSKTKRRAKPKAIPKPIVVLKCTDCEKTFDKNHQLNKHMNTHYRKFQCNLCSEFTASVKRDLTRHQNSVHRQDTGFYCPVPGCDRSLDADELKPFGRHDNLVRHGRKLHNLELGKSATSP